MKPKLIFVDHSYHKKTMSTIFMRKLLKEQFTVINVWDESWKKQNNYSISEICKKYNAEYILFFQLLPIFEELKQLKSNIIWIPMYDNVVYRGYSFWLQLSTLQIKIISFSSTLTKIIKKNGIDVLSVKFFLNPNEFDIVEITDSKRIFFWQRTGFNFKTLKGYLGNQKIDKIILKIDPDPNFKKYYPTKKDIKKYNIEIIEGFMSKERYLQEMLKCNIYVAPRKYEGIGMSFIEAMHMGMSVIAYDNPTMNEYIIHNKTGYLLSNKLINLNNHKKISFQTLYICQIGYKKWNESKTKIAPFIVSNNKKTQNLNSILRIYIYIIRSIYKILKKFNINFEIL